MKIDNKAMELEQQASLSANPNQQSPIDILRERLMPQRPKLTPQPTMKVMSNNGELLGAGKVTSAKKGSTIKAFNPYGTKKTQGLNPKKVIMGQGSGAMQSNEKMYTGKAKTHNTDGA